MPVILDRLPLPNISWYSGISVLCLLCSVYYAGVQVKIHPNWKEQLQQRHNTALHTNKYEDPVSSLHWGVFNNDHPDDEGFCWPSMEDELKFGDGQRQVHGFCTLETFEDLLRATFYDEMCYIRYNSVDAAFTNFVNSNAARAAQGKAEYAVSEYSRRCQQAARKLALKYNISNKANTINIFQDNDKDIGQHSSSLPASLTSPGKTAQLNQCTTDTFYDSYERDSEVSLYHIPLQEQGCEREMSPYLIPEIISFMFHEPLCIWTLINMAYCILILLGTTIQHMVFGELRVSEQQHIKDKFWNFVFYKFIFVFGVMNVKHMDEAVLWCSWFSVLGFLHLLAQLCKDRFEYLSFSGHTGRRTHLRLLGLLGIILLVASACLLISLLVGCHAGINTFAFMAAECVLLIVRTLYVITRYTIYLWDITHQGLWEKRGGYVYVMELVFELSELTIDMVHHVHMLVWGNIMLTMASLVICMQLRLLFYQLQHKVKSHRNYLRVRKLLARYAEVVKPVSDEKEAITCAICWESVARGRRLPCQHVFHTDCLLAWLPQHLSCPTCRHKLRAAMSTEESGQQSLFSRLFSRRSSDPLDASLNNNNEHNSGSNTASNTSSSNNSHNNSPRHEVSSAPRDESDGLVAAGVSHSEVRERLVAITATNSSTSSSAATDDTSDHKTGDGRQHSAHGENSNGLGAGHHSLLDTDAVFWGSSEGAGGEGDGGRYVSWLPSFSVEQRHTQFPPQRHTTPAPDSSVHAMAMQVQQLFPHVQYSVLVSDLRRTRSIVHTIDNILEDDLPVHVYCPPTPVANAANTATSTHSASAANALSTTTTPGSTYTAGVALSAVSPATVPTSSSPLYAHATGETSTTVAKTPVPVSVVTCASNTVSPAVEDECAPVKDEFPVVKDESHAVEDESPGVEDESFAVEDESFAVEDESPALEDESPACLEQFPLASSPDSGSSMPPVAALGGAPTAASVSNLENLSPAGVCCDDTQGMSKARTTKRRGPLKRNESPECDHSPVECDLNSPSDVKNNWNGNKRKNSLAKSRSSSTIIDCGKSAEECLAPRTEDPSLSSLTCSRCEAVVSRQCGGLVPAARTTSHTDSDDVQHAVQGLMQHAPDVAVCCTNMVEPPGSCVSPSRLQRTVADTDCPRDFGGGIEWHDYSLSSSSNRGTHSTSSNEGSSSSSAGVGAAKSSHSPHTNCSALRQRTHQQPASVQVESASGASLSVGCHGSRFSKCPTERQSLLHHRQQQLYHLARNRFLATNSDNSAAGDGAK